MYMQYVNFCRLFAVLVLLHTFMPPGAEGKPVPGKKANMALSALAGMTAGHFLGRATVHREKKEKLDMSEHLPPNCRKEVRTERDPQDWNKFIETKIIVCDPLPNQQPQQQQQQQIVSLQTGSSQPQQGLYPNLYVPQQQVQQQPQPQQQQMQQQYPQQHLQQQQHQLQPQEQQPQQHQQQPMLQQQQQQQPQQSQQSTGQQQYQQVQPQPSYYMPIYPQLPMSESQQPASHQYPSVQQQNNQSIAQQQYTAPYDNHWVQQQPEKSVQTAPQTIQVPTAPQPAAPQATEKSKPFLEFIKNLQERVAKRNAERAAQQASADGVKDSYLRIQQAVDQPNPPTEQQHKSPQKNSEKVESAAAAQAEPIVQPSVVVPVQPAAPSIQQVQAAAIAQPNQGQTAGFQQPAMSGQPIGFVQPTQQAGQPPAQPPQTVQAAQLPQQVQSPQPLQPVQPVQTVQISQPVQTFQSPQSVQTGPQPMQPVQVVQQAQPAQPTQGTSQVFVLSKKTGYFGKSSSDKTLQTNLVLMMMMAFLLIWFQ